MTDTQTLEILDVLKSLPSEKVAEVKDFAVFLRERYGKNETTDASDEWTNEDLRDFSDASMNRADEFEKAKMKTPAERLSEIAALPEEGTGEKFSNRDHDRILYGKANEK
jgi:hypothetical protein